MLTFGKLMSRRRTTDDAEIEEQLDDEPRILDAVPEEILNPPRPEAPPIDNSWMETVPLADKSGHEEPQPQSPSLPPPAKELRAPAAKPEDTPARAVSKPDFLRKSANKTPAGRPRFPHGWLVVVEGPGVGEWFLLEHGVSHLGSAEGQTVRLDFGDPSIAAECHAALAFDDGRNSFILDAPAEAAVRLNGIPTTGRTRLRDGDVISLGGTSLRLVALCSPNFHWSSELRAE